MIPAQTDVLAAMENADYQSYIRSYVWKSELVNNKVRTMLARFFLIWDKGLIFYALLGLEQVW